MQTPHSPHLPRSILRPPVASRAAVGTLALIACAAITGCAEQRASSYASTDQWRAANRQAGLVTTPAAMRTSPGTASSMHATNANTASPTSSTQAMLEMHAPVAAPPAQTASNPSTSSASRAMNLYGELEAASNAGPDAGTPLDGSVNLVQVSFATEGNCVDPDIDSTGNLLVFASTMHRRTSDIYLKTATGRTITQLTSDPADDAMPAFNPDGTKIAFTSNRAGNWDIYITGIDGGPATEITSDPDPELHPTWSPDGRYLAYCRFGAQSARWEIWMTEAANPGVKRFLDYGVFPEWCPDVTRSKIVFQRAKQRGSRDYGIWTIDIANGQASQPTEIVSAANAALINPCWSPDGSRIAFVAIVDPQADGARPQQSDVWVVNVDGSGRTNLTSGQFANFQPAWASDGSVYFVSDRSGTDNVWAVQSATGGMMNKPQPHDVANADNGAVLAPE